MPHKPDARPKAAVKDQPPAVERSRSRQSDRRDKNEQPCSRERRAPYRSRSRSLERQRSRGMNQPRNTEQSTSREIDRGDTHRDQGRRRSPFFRRNRSASRDRGNRRDNRRSPVRPEPASGTVSREQFDQLAKTVETIAAMFKDQKKSK